MPCRNPKKTCKIALLLFCLAFVAVCECGAQDFEPFQGEINSENANLRADATVTSETICMLNKGDGVEVVRQLYDWYKIRLPRQAPSYISKDFVSDIGKDRGEVLKDNVNIRLRPDISAPILGRLNSGDLVIILEGTPPWYKIEPVKNSFGWVNMKLVNKTSGKRQFKTTKAQQRRAMERPLQQFTESKEPITVEGTIKAKFFTSAASHKLITDDKKVYLLRGNPKIINSLNGKRAKVTGRLKTDYEKDIIFLDVANIEGID